jgi:molybdenum ABC transporter molybdate-binding protein
MLSRISMYAVPLLGIAVVAVAVRLYMTGDHVAPRTESSNVRLLCDRSLREPIAGAPLEHGGGVIDLFQRRSGVAIDVTYGEHANLLEKLATAQADLFLPSDPQLIREAQQQGLVTETISVTRLVPVILVQRDNPQNIQNVADLASDKIRLAVAAEDTELGRVTAELLARHKLNPAELGNVNTEEGSRQAAEAVHRRAVDAAIVWRHDSVRFPATTTPITIPADGNVHAELLVGVLRDASRPEEAKEFARFLAGSVGQNVLARFQLGEPPREDDEFDFDFVGELD